MTTAHWNKGGFSGRSSHMRLLRQTDSGPLRTGPPRQPTFQSVQTNFLAVKTNWAHHQRDFSKSHFSMPVQKKPGW